MPALPATFNDFLGNSAAIEHLRTAIAAGRLPHSLILAGPSGAGKYTLALMLAMAVECERQPRDLWSNGQSLATFCGVCHNCTRIASVANLEEEVNKAVAIREELREADKKDTRVLIQPHPDVLIIPPDPPQLLIKLGQIRTLIQRAHYLPSEAPRRIFILTASNFMKEAANSLLKVLEEPPEFATIFLLTENAGELLPTIRSRSMIFPLGALLAEEIESYLAQHRPDWNVHQRALVARLCGGAIGRARSFDLAAYVAARANALNILKSALPGGGEHSELFKITESYRAGAEGREKTEQLIRTLYSLLRDLMFLASDAPELVRNTDIQQDLQKLANAADFAWIAFASDRLGEVERGMRRNLLRSLSLDAFATALEKV